MHRFRIIPAAMFCLALFPPIASPDVLTAQAAEKADPKAKVGSKASKAATRPATPSVRIIELHGDAAALGKAHGQQLGDIMRPLFRQYFGQFFANQTQHQLAMLAAAGFDPFLLPEHRDEIKALAAGSGLKPAEVMLAQCFLDLSPAIGCSTIALPPAASPDGVARMGRNLDFASFNIADRNSVVLAFRPKDRYAFVAVTWPGIIGVLSGMNEHGLTLACMEVSRPLRAAQAMPYTLLYRMLLERCKTVDEAIALLEKTPRQSANNLMLMDAAGNRAVAEITPEKVTVRRAPAKAALISTNHQRGPDLDTAGHCDRFDRLHDLARTQFGRISERSLEQMLARVMMGNATFQSMVFEPANRVLYLALGANAPARGFTRVDLRPYLNK